MSDMMSGVSGAGGGDMMRLVGMATGMDVDGTVKKMLLGEQKKIDVVKQQKQALEWKQEEYKEVIKSAKALQDKYFNVTSKDCLLKESSYSDFDVTSTLSSVATATASAGAVDGTYKFEVKSLATGAKFESNLKVGKENAKLTSTLKELNIVDKKGDIKFDVNGSKISIQIKETDKLSDLINKINNSSKGKVKARYSELTGKFTVETRNTGKEAKLNVENFLGKSQQNITGQDAEVVFTESAGQKITEKYDENNEGIKITRSSNNFTIDGVNYSLKGTGTTTVSVTGNADKTFDRIKGFMDDYNALVGTITKKLNEKKDYSYKPLTDNQKKQMKEGEIKAWEERAKKGILRNDPNLQRMLSELRSTFFRNIPTSELQFNRTDLGLDTNGDLASAGQIKFSTGGEEKFKKILKERPAEVIKLFTGSYELTTNDKKEIGKAIKGESVDDKYKYLNGTGVVALNRLEAANERFKYDNLGIFQKMSSIFKTYVGEPGITLNNSILAKYANRQEDFSFTGTGGHNSLPDQIYRKDRLIRSLNEKMKAREEQLYKQFSMLETVMNKYNAQAGWLAQQFGGGM